jgi:hypothetical protein
MKAKILEIEKFDGRDYYGTIIINGSNHPFVANHARVGPLHDGDHVHTEGMHNGLPIKVSRKTYISEYKPPRYITLVRKPDENPITVPLGFSWSTLTLQHALGLPMLYRALYAYAIVSAAVTVSLIVFGPSIVDFIKEVLLMDRPTRYNDPYYVPRDTFGLTHRASEAESYGGWFLILIILSVSLFSAWNINKWHIQELISCGWKTPRDADPQDVSYISKKLSINESDFCSGINLGSAMVEESRTFKATTNSRIEATLLHPFRMWRSHIRARWK